MKDLKGKYTLLFFYEPDCHTCIQTKASLRQSAFLNNLIERSVVSVLAFYPQDDKPLWLQRLPECSANWVNGYDPDGCFTEKQPYDLRAFPTFYLLDKEKKVLLKDAPIEAVLEYLQQNS
jgi:thioredoxin-related protein